MLPPPKSAGRTGSDRLSWSVPDPTDNEEQNP
jgi:hypothetical protein